MDDLISRRDAVSRFSDLLMIELRGERLPTWNEVYNAIKEVPSARRKGKWIEYNGTGKKQWMCSECCAEEKNPKGARFCYWCGAFMKGEEDETD